MGIPGCYRRLIETYGNVNEALKKLLNDDNIFLYADFNGMIHPCVGRVIDRHMKDKKIDREQIEKEIFVEIKKHTLEIINKINPKFVMIAIDGAAPRAKQEQQRTRRYKSVIEKKDRRHIFDTNAISPGTNFMKRLTQEMKLLIDNELKTRNIKVLFMDHTKAGEGEHKIIQFIKDFKHTKSVTHIIYGLDADLIFLSLTTGLDNIYLLRDKQVFELKKEDDKKKWENKGTKKEEQKNQENDEEAEEDTMDKCYQYLHIKKLKEYYWNDINKDFNYSTMITRDQFFKDLVMIWMFIGNDFLPHLKVFNIYKNGIEMLLEKYLEQLKIFQQPLLSDDLLLNQEMLLAMFKEINDNEEKYIDKNNKKGQDRVIKYFEKGWRNRFYSYYFGRLDEKGVKQISQNYCEILKWNIKYYFKGNDNWSWYYRFPCPPCFSDLYKYLQNNDINEIEIPHDEPYKPIRQLLTILPPQSAHLIPRKYSHLMFGRLQHLYPRRFKMDYVDIAVRFMCKPILPRMDDALLKNLVHE